MILMIASDGKQNNVFSIYVLLPIAILSGFQVFAKLCNFAMFVIILNLMFYVIYAMQLF